MLDAKTPCGPGGASPMRALALQPAGETTPYATPWTGLGQEVLMPIRITHPHKWLSPRQETEGTGFTASSVRYAKASYTDRTQEARILCGSI